jgi:hypothetical protein
MNENIHNGIGGLKAQDKPLRKPAGGLPSENEPPQRKVQTQEQKPKEAAPAEVPCGEGTVNNHEQRLLAIEKKLNMR